MKDGPPLKALPWVLSLGSGLLLALAFLGPRPWAGPVLAPVALVPWVILFSPDGLRAPAWLILPGAYLFGILAGLPLLGESIVLGLLAPLAFIPFLLPFAVVLRRLPRWRWLPPWLAVPILWVGTEWIRCTYSPGSLEIYLLGHGVSPVTALIQAADLVGSYGISFLVAGANSIVAFEILSRMKRSPAGGSEASSARAVRIGTLGGLICLSFVYGVVSLLSLEVRPGPRLFAVRIGGSRVRPDAPREQEKRYVEQTYRTVSRDAGADLIVWPKDAIPDILLFDVEYLEDLKSLGNWFQCPIFVGARGVTGRFPDVYRHVAVHMTAGGDPARDYPQMQLLPGFEYAPLEMQLRRFELDEWRMGWGDAAKAGGKATRWVVGAWLGATPRLQRGHDLRLFDLDEETSFGAPLGFEGLSQGWCRGAKEKGASFIVSLDRRRSGTAGLCRAALAAATFRAIESRMSFVRVEEDGQCFLIDPAGRLVRLQEEHSRTEPAFDVQIPVLSSPSEGASRGGEILGRLAALLCIALLGRVLMRGLGGPAISMDLSGKHPKVEKR